MLLGFKNAISKANHNYKLYKSFECATKLVENSPPKEALEVFNFLLKKEPDNEYARRQIVLLRSRVEKDDVPILCNTNRKKENSPTPNL